MDVPSLTLERRLWRSGYARVAGIDEAGRGALAGPVVAAAVIVPAGSRQMGIWSAVRDSKMLPPARRESLTVQIESEAAAWSIGQASAAEIDAAGIAPATRLAMRRAVQALSPPPDYLLIDWVRLAAVNIPQESFPKGDQRVVAIAAASILAKCHRDRLLRLLHDDYPRYGFASHKGYGAEAHRKAIELYGPCAEHRLSFAPLRRDVKLFE